MAQTRQIKARISTSKNIAQITGAMQMVAASKMQRAQDQAIKARVYATALAESLQILSKKTDSSLHPLLQKHDRGLDIAVLISTEKGLCGRLNTLLFKKANHWKKQYPAGKLIVVGKKAVHLAKIYGFSLYAQFTNFPDQVTPNDVVAINTLITKSFLKKEFKTVHLIYTDFINTLSQKAVIQSLLPLGISLKSWSGIEGESQPKKQKSKQESNSSFIKKTSLKKKFDKAYLFEPSPEQILKTILPLYLENNIFHAFLEAKASEHSARMLAMKNASENAQDLIEELQLQYNRSRQEEITNELLDQVTATIVLK